MNKVHFSTGKDDWGTPQDLFDALNKEFNFTLDPCADNNNHKCAKYYTIEQDGLAQSWAGETVFATRHIAGKQKQMPVKSHGYKNVTKRQPRGGSSWLCLYPPEQIRSCFTITF